MTGNLTTTEWFKGKFNWTTTDDWSSFDGSIFDFNESKLSTTYYNASAINVVTGTGAGTLGDIQDYNLISYNVTETDSDFELIVNFTGIEEFTTLLVRHKTNIDAGHTAAIQIWDYGDSDWEGYGLLTESLTSEMKTLGVYDDADHIQDGVVQVRFYQDEGPPKTAHIHQFDWVELSKGLGTPVGQEVDPLSVHRDGNTPLTANWGQGAFNLTNTDSWFLGKINASNVQNNNWLEDSQESNLNVNSSVYWDNYSTSDEWLTPSQILDIDDEDVESDLNTYVDIAGDEMTGNLTVPNLFGNLYGSWNGTYFNNIVNFTGTLTDEKYCTYDSTNGVINCTSEGGTDTTLNLNSPFLYNVSGEGYFNETHYQENLTQTITNMNSSLSEQDISDFGFLKLLNLTTYITTSNESWINTLIDSKVIQSFVNALGFYNTTEIDSMISPYMNETTLASTYLNLSGTNADQNVNISDYNFSAKYINGVDFNNITTVGNNITWEIII